MDLSRVQMPVFPSFVRRIGYMVVVVCWALGVGGGCQCGGESVIKDFQCEDHKGCEKYELCVSGTCKKSDDDNDGWSPQRGKGIEDCDDQDPNVYPGAAEICDNQKDDNCNGVIDEKDCRCEEDATRSCGSDKGSCKPGTERCVRGKWSECSGGIGPQRELCNGVDDDCDGQIDEDFPVLGKQCEVGQGECKAIGKYICSSDRQAAECDVKPGQPTAEKCDNKDNDCDGQTDEIDACRTAFLQQVTLSCLTSQSSSPNYKHVGLLGQMTPINGVSRTAKSAKYVLTDGFLNRAR